MELKRISKIKNYRIFKDYIWPNDLDDFGRYNVIYGWNGSGKTTLSTLFLAIEKKQPISEGGVEFKFGDRFISGSDLEHVSVPQVRVFNRDFIGRSVFETAGGELPPVYYLGEDSADKQRRIVELTEEQSKWHGIKMVQENQLKQANDNLDIFCTEQARAIKLMLTTSGGGPYNTYDARRFKADIQQMMVLETKPNALTEAERDEHLKIHQSKVLPNLLLGAVNFPDVADLRSRAEKILHSSVVSNVIDGLATDQALSTWISDGLALHRGTRITANCRFCEQPLPSGRVERLEAHFNDQFKQLKQNIEVLLNDVDRAMGFEGQLLNIPHEAALYESLQKKFNIALNEIKRRSDNLRQALKVIKDALLEKRNSPFEKIELDGVLERIDHNGGPLVKLLSIAADVFSFTTSFPNRNSLDELRNIVAEHNVLTANFSVSQNNSRDLLAKDEVLRVLNRWQNLKQASIDAENIRNQAAIEEEKYKKEILILQRDIHQHHRPAEELNREIAGYLGRSELKFVTEQNGYRIFRGNQPAMHLSDGERTAVAFMYFLKSIQDTSFNLKNGIVVIDDPVSSLDTNSLFSAFGFMKDRTVDAKQLFILTHNFSFFRQVKNWFNSLNDKKSKPAKYYALSSSAIGTERSSFIEKIDPFLTEYESEYHYLFKKVYDLSRVATASAIEDYYGMPNIARRLLESFMAYRMPGKTGKLHSQITEIKLGDTAKKTRILRFINTFSHNEIVSSPDQDPSILAETPAILSDVMDLIKVNDEPHFDAMVKLCSG